MENKAYYLELSDKKHHKFYEIICYDYKVKVIYGRIGNTGKTTIKSFISLEDSSKFFENQILNKIKKGYVFVPKGITPQRKKNIHPGQLYFSFLISINDIKNK